MRKILILLTALLASSGLMAQSTIFCNSSTGNDVTGNGTSGNPWKTLTKAITEASSGDEINLTGTFTFTDVDETLDAVGTGITLNKSLTLTGQNPYSTIIQAASSAYTADRRIFTLEGGNTLILNNLGIKNGYLNTSSSQGGAIFSHGILEIDNCNFESNQAQSSGGAIYIDGNDYNSAWQGDLTVTNSTFYNNSVFYYSASAIWVDMVEAPYDVTITNCTFLENHSDHANCLLYNTCNAAAVFITRTQNTYLTNCTFNNNTTAVEVYASNSNVYIKNCILANSDDKDLQIRNGSHVYVTNSIYETLELVSTMGLSYNADNLTGNQSNLNLSSTLALNGTSVGTKTLALSSGSVAINSGDDSSPNGFVVYVPCGDQRGKFKTDGRDMGAYEYNGGTECPADPNQWTGASSSDWNDPANWTLGEVPSNMHDVTIPTGVGVYPILNSGGTMQTNDLIVQLNGTLTVPPGAGLNIMGDLVNDGRIVLKSDITGTASMLDNGNISGSGTVVMERYLTKSGYHHIGASHSNATISEIGDDMNLILGSPYVGGDTSVTSSPFPTLFAYDETNTSPTMSLGWDHPGTNFEVGRGYATNFGYYPIAKTIDIEGSTNTGSINIPVSNTPSGTPAADGWNLVCNPYPSALNWDNVTKTNVPDGYYCFVATGNYTGTYYSYVNGISNPGGALSNLIPTSQAFFVKATANGSLSMDNSAREINNSIFFKSETAKVNNNPTIRLTGIFLNGGTIADETVIYFDQNATANFDTDFDALKIFNNDPLIPNIYTKTANLEALSINGMPSIDVNEVIVPIGFKVDQAGDYRIDGSQIQNFPPNIGIYLVDISLNKTIDLRTNPFYQFNSNPNDSADRFYLRFTPMIATGIEITEDSWNHIYTENNNLHISLFDEENVSLKIMNVAGQLVYEKSDLNTGNHILPMDIPTGHYLIMLSNEEKITTRKVFFR